MSSWLCSYCEAPADNFYGHGDSNGCEREQVILEKDMKKHLESASKKSYNDVLTSEEAAAMYSYFFIY